MTDPVRRDPTEFLRVLRRMSRTTSWQKTMIFAMKGRMVGYRLTREHYNTVLFSQSLWGRALEIVRVIRSMQEDNVQPNGATYYYIVNGMANADHGWNYDLRINPQLEKIQHWRVALEALEACEANGFDSTDTMHNSALITMVIPGVNRLGEASQLFQKMLQENRQLHPTMVKFYHDCLVRNMRPREASELLRIAAERGVQGYEDKWEADVFKVPARQEQQQQQRRSTAYTFATLQLRGDQRILPDELQAMLEEETVRNIETERAVPIPYSAGLHPSEMNSVFRPRVYRQLWYKWQHIANRYRPTTALKRRQLAPRDSPTGIPGFNRL
ncbi:hypothetical protein DQ04_08341020 [Trypanosoma grayi]|uniref:hypothetical protein n=1 Tax=Trypanosoma grayi TaxID=71804 RepID=UPI0004F43F9C|nr:hypothetical protein DQ04_08341020 [Trypanosoma grayi]KEG07971.1 hypothetical protein DQ04_08341020 [Trypanosoma grayi]